MVFEKLLFSKYSTLSSMRKICRLQCLKSIGVRTDTVFFSTPDLNLAKFQAHKQRARLLIKGTRDMYFGAYLKGTI